MQIISILVDDDEGLCACLIPALKDLTDVRVEEIAQTPADAMSLMAKYEEDWQLLILDIDLRNGSGLGVLEMCQKRLPHQVVFVLTNMATPYVRSRCLALGADAVFNKTTELDNFFEQCKKLKVLSYS